MRFWLPLVIGLGALAFGISEEQRAGKVKPHFAGRRAAHKTETPPIAKTKNPWVKSLTYPKTAAEKKPSKKTHKKHKHATQDSHSTLIE